MPRKKRKRARSSKAKRQFLLQIAIGVLLFAFLALILFGVWHGARLQRYTIADIVVSGGDTISHEMIRARVAKELEGSYALLVPFRFVWTYPHDAIVAAVEEFPRVKRAEVVLEDRTLLVMVDEHAPVWVWCASATSTECMFLNRDGYAFAKSPALSGNVLPRLYDERTQSTTTERILDTPESTALDTLEEMLFERYGMRVVEVTRVSDDTFELLLARESILKISTTQSPLEVVDNLATIFASAEFRHLRTEPFAYIDLRFGNRVFVREEDAPATTTETYIEEQ